MNPIKQFSRTWASSNCSSCFMNTDCVRASAFGYDKRKYALVSKGFRQKPTLAMLKGTEMHEQLASEYPPLDIADIRKGIKQGKKVILAEQGFCNVNFGMRCHCDLVEIQLIEDKMKIKITDYKTSFWPTQLFQVTVEGMIFSSRNCKIIIEEDGKKKAVSLYPKIPFDVDIELILDIRKTGQKIYKDFMVDGELTQWGSNYRWAVNRIATNFRKFHRAGIYWINELEFCRGCRKKIESCSFWRICSKSIPSEPEKYNQRYIANRIRKGSILKKTKPKGE